MVTFLIAFILIAVFYLVHKTVSIEKRQASIAESLGVQIKDIRAAQEIPPRPLAYGWFDDGWPVPKMSEETFAPLENPEPHRNPDDYQTQMWIGEFQSLNEPHDRKEFLCQLRKARAWMLPEFLDVIYKDESAYVRAWAAGHLALDFKDYTDREKAREIRNYELNLLRDPDPLVRAALWGNPNKRGLPWSIEVSKHWKEEFRTMSSLERLGLMRNPDLSKQYVVALLETEPEELGISREEHARILMTAAVNPNLVGRSRMSGREAWTGFDGDAFPPFEEYSKMWELSLQRWLDDSGVAYCFIKYIQTTPETKITAYKRLLEKRNGKDLKWLREEVIRSCDPIRDSKVLKLAWDDPDEDCRKLAVERVGPFAKFVGVKKSKG